MYVLVSNVVLEIQVWWNRNNCLNLPLMFILNT